MSNLRSVSWTVTVLVCVVLVGVGIACKSSGRGSGYSGSSAPTDVTDAVEVSARAPGRDYCTYRVVTAQGPDCGVFRPGALICVDCPARPSCPGAAGGRSRYRYVDREGEEKCRGEWAKRFDVNDPDACIDCPIPPGNPGFEFVNR
jgi:hypothetical protein